MTSATAGAGNSLDNVGKKAQKVKTEIDNTGAGADKTLKGLLSFNMAVEVFNTVKGAIESVGESMNHMNSMYQFQITQENKLATVMRARMGANDEMIQDMKDYASSLQETGIIGDEVMLSGAQELATYISDAETLKTLLPTLNDIAVQASPDMNISAQEYSGLATMLGKVMGGSLGGMSKRGWVFTEEEKAAFTKMNELQRAQFLADYAKDAIGNQNMDAARTAQGQMQQLANSMGDMEEELGRALESFNVFRSMLGGNWKMQWLKMLTTTLNNINKHPLVKAIIGGALITMITLLGTILVASVVPALVTIIGQLTIIAALKTAIEGPFAILGLAIGGAIAAFVTLNHVSERYGRINEDLLTMADGGRSIIDSYVDSFNSLTPAIRNSADEMGRFYENLTNVALADATYNGMSMEYARTGHVAEGTDDATQLQFYRTEMSRIAHDAEVYNKIKEFNWRSASMEEFKEEVSRLYGAGMAATNQLIAYKREYDELMIKADEATQRIVAQNEELRRQEELAERIKQSRQAALDMENDIATAYGATDAGRKEEQLKELQKYKDMLSAGGYELLVKNDSGGADTQFKNFTGEQMRQLRVIVAEMEKKLKTDGSGALITKDKGFVEISNDYRELLSKTATRRFNLAFKNVEPTVNVGGIVIQESADEGKIIQIITEAVTNVSSSSLDSESA